MSTLTRALTVEDYERAFEAERVHTYPMIDAIEQEAGFALDPDRYLPAAKVLACPVKVNPPSWQHGRVLYALTRQYLTGATGPVQLLDIGTAKGYSALCLQWALQDSGVHGRVTSVDVMDPHGTDRRNTIAECDGPKSLHDVLAPWPDAARIDLLKSTGQQWLSSSGARVHVAFVDGKHTFDAVKADAALLGTRQQTGDLIVFDDVQIPAVHLAVSGLKGYAVRFVDVLLNRRYAIARRA